MNWLKTQLNSSKAAWKVLANEVTIMPTRVLGGAFFGFDSWDGYPQERESLLTHIRDRQIKDVVFVTGDIHTFIAGDVRTAAGTGDPAAIEFVGGSVTSVGPRARPTCRPAAAWSSRATTRTRTPTRRSSRR